MFTKKGIAEVIRNSNRVTISVAEIIFGVEIGFEDRVKRFTKDV